uniref:Immunoglobulin domain-containing protein n=1 Tax=Timema monikensis TaxID=170555 RepID=A0A7R9EKK1_9NEOP|nr:unnamed protein product [Timema monikensis]
MARRIAGGGASFHSHDWVKMSEAPPTIINTRLGDRVELDCEAIGSPAPTIHWIRGTAPLSQVYIILDQRNCTSLTSTHYTDSEELHLFSQVYIILDQRNCTSLTGTHYTGSEELPLSHKYTLHRVRGTAPLSQVHTTPGQRNCTSLTGTHYTGQRNCTSLTSTHYTGQRNCTSLTSTDYTGQRNCTSLISAHDTGQRNCESEELHLSHKYTLHRAEEPHLSNRYTLHRVRGTAPLSQVHTTPGRGTAPLSQVHITLTQRNCTSLTSTHYTGQRNCTFLTGAHYTDTEELHLSHRYTLHRVRGTAPLSQVHTTLGQRNCTSLTSIHYTGTAPLSQDDFENNRLVNDISTPSGGMAKVRSRLVVDCVMPVHEGIYSCVATAAAQSILAPPTMLLVQEALRLMPYQPMSTVEEPVSIFAEKEELTTRYGRTVRELEKLDL